MVEAITGSRVDLRRGPRREGDPPVLIADARRAHELLGWSPRYSDPVRVVESAWAWQLPQARAAQLTERDPLPRR